MKQQPNNTFAVFLTALSNLQEGRTELAIEYLKDVRINDANLYEDATWYLALAYLKKEDKAGARYYLEELLKLPYGFYEAKAKSLKSKL